MSTAEKFLQEHGTVTEFPADQDRKPRQKFELVPFQKIALNRHSRYLLKGLIPQDAMCIIWGEPKCGKSFFAMDMALHIALDREYRGRRVRGGPVVYAALEGSAGYGARIEAFRRHHRIPADRDVPFLLLAERLDLINEYEQLIKRIEEQTRMLAPAAIFIDTLNRSLEGSESSDEDMSRYIRAADAVKFHFRCSVIIIHHCGYNDGRMRGHSSLPGALDAEISVKKEAGGSFVAKVERMKDGPEGDVIGGRLMTVDLGEDDDGDSITSCVVEPSEPEEDQTGQKPAKLTKGAQIALRALIEALSEEGTLAPSSDHIPVNTNVVTVEAWRQRSYARGISTGEPRAKQLAFTRSTEALIAAGSVRTWNGLVWISG